MQIDLVAWGDTVSGLSLKAGQTNATITAQGFTYSLKPESYSGPALMEIYKFGDGQAKPLVEPSAEDKAHEGKPLTEADVPRDSGSKVPAKQGLALELEKRRKEKPNLVALAPLPSAGCRRATVLLAPADGGTFTCYVIDDDPTKLPLGQLRIHNLSPYQIQLRCNGVQAKELKPQATFLASGKNEQLIYELAYKEGDEWKMQENNIIPLRNTEQTQMMILKSDNKFFLSNDGNAGGFLQIVTLRRRAAAP